MESVTASHSLPNQGTTTERKLALEATATVTTASDPATTITKVIVAVHGVGEQHSFATIQSVANQFCSFYGQPAAIPLGSFHTTEGTFSVRPPYAPNPLGTFAFGEVYWAKIPRELVSDNYTLEEAKKWARTIVGRLQLRARNKSTCTDEDFQQLGNVLTEMVQTIAVLDRLCFLADKAGLFTFNLRRILDDFLGDVQVVAEFEPYRRKILDLFASTMNKVYEDFSTTKRDGEKKPDIYIVAHSEGSVVALLGLLEGLRDHHQSEENAPWVECVRGLMTIGSPIDKHLMLWPELFTPFERPYEPPQREEPNRIEWRNYYDRGDPIGFELDVARKWLGDNGWKGAFDFKAEHDVGFDRYTLPGKAHVDYWTDPAVFGHFIQNVVKGDRIRTEGAPKKDFAKPPRDILSKKWLSYVVPYVGVTLLVFVATFLLYKALVGVVVLQTPTNCGSPGASPNELLACDLTSIRGILRRVTGMTLLVLGITVLARIPRLTRDAFWRGLAVVIAVVGAGAYLWSVRTEDPRELIGHAMRPGIITVTLAVLVLAVIYLVGTRRPSWGMTPLILLGTALVAGKIGYAIWVAAQAGEIGSVWPVFIATAGFLYLWWLAALLLDLVFVWHVYIRQSKVNKRMCEIVGVTPIPDGAPAVV